MGSSRRSKDSLGELRVSVMQITARCPPALLTTKLVGVRGPESCRILVEWSYSRKTVTRVFSDLKKQQIIQFKGSTLLIRKATLKLLTAA